jgi:plastocyanin
MLMATRDWMQAGSAPGGIGTRRRILQGVVGGTGGLFVVTALRGRDGWSAIARSDEDDDRDDRRDDDDSGRDDRGGDGDSGRNDRGHDDSGRDDDRHDDEDAVAVAGAAPPGSLEVRIVGDDAGDFVPGELTVDVGQSVTFVNVHSDEHTATGSGFDTGIIPDEGGTATVLLDTPGVFPYSCLIHPEMTGVVRVRDENGVVPETQTATQEVPADATTVVIANLAFDPAAITVPTGTTVAWSNDDSVPHTVTSTDGVFDSGIFDPGGSFAFTFNEPGSFPYICQLHPQMQGTVTAEGEPVAGGTQAAQAGGGEEPAPVAQTANPPRAAADGTSVSIVDFAFEPATLAVAAGDTVTWTNEGVAPHTVTGDFADSGVLDPGQTFSHTFDAEGTFDYVCAIRPDMVGSVAVGAAAPGGEAAATGDAAAGLPGAWLFALTPDADAPVPPQQVLLGVRPDGTLEADFAAAGDAAGGPAWTVRDGQGTWEAAAEGYALRVVALLVDGEERYAGLLRYQEAGEIDAAGEAASGAAAIAVAGPGGEPVASGTGTTRGTRLRLDEAGAE